MLGNLLRRILVLHPVRSDQLLHDTPGRARSSGSPTDDYVANGSFKEEIGNKADQVAGC
jgi:hypothetical protein